MQVTETVSEGLKREFKVVVAAADIATRVEQRLGEIGKTINLPGFRPGKVPLPVLRKRYGQAITGEVLEGAMNEGASKAMTERGLRPAMQPRVQVEKFEEGKDLEYKLTVELLPEIKPVNFAELELERLKAPVEDEEVDKAVKRLADARMQTEKIAEDRAAEKGDVVVADFVGRINGEAFQGGTGIDVKIEIGSGQFIPGFEDQLVGHKAASDVEVKVTFPADYGAKEVAGKDAVFAVKVKELHRRMPAEVNDDFAKGFGADSIDELRSTIRDQMARDYQRAARLRVKRQLLDKLADSHDFAVPEGMVDLEFQTIWSSIEAERKRGTDDPSIAGKSDDELRTEYRPIAERRVRLGLLLAEVGRQNNLNVSQEEMNRAMIEEARRYPGQERKVVDFLRGNENAQAQLRAPIFEDKVVDFILEIAKIKERQVSAEELLKMPDDD